MPAPRKNKINHLFYLVVILAALAACAYGYQQWQNVLLTRERLNNQPKQADLSEKLQRQRELLAGLRQLLPEAPPREVPRIDKPRQNDATGTTTLRAQARPQRPGMPVAPPQMQLPLGEIGLLQAETLPAAMENLGTVLGSGNPELVDAASALLGQAFEANMLRAQIVRRLGEIESLPPLPQANDHRRRLMRENIEILDQLDRKLKGMLQLSAKYGKLRGQALDADEKQALQIMAFAAPFALLFFFIWAYRVGYARATRKRLVPQAPPAPKPEN